MKNKNSFLTVLLVGALMLSPTKTMAQSNVVGEAIGLGVELLGGLFTNPDEEDGYTDIVINCTVLQCDEYGNWIKRKDIYNNGWSVIITRTISYY